MTDSTRQWQVTIWIGQDNPDSKIFYGDTFRSLRQAVREWLTEKKPTSFYSADTICYYSDKTRTDDILAGNDDKRWYLQAAKGFRFFHSSPGTFGMALEEFTTKGMLPEKGPDYQDIAIVDGKLQLYLIKTVRHEEEHADNDLPQRVNSLLKRGWYLLSKERSEYVLGHTEEDAI